MEEAYVVLYQGGSGEITEKKSRFIADLKPVSTEEEALEFIGDDELVEVTPKNIRLRKRILDNAQRMKAIMKK